MAFHFHSSKPDGASESPAQQERTGNKPRYLLTPFDPDNIPKLMTWFKTAHDVIFWSGFKFTYPFDLASFTAQLKLKQIAAYSLIETNSGELLGFGQVMFDQGRCHLVRIAVNPEHRQHGHGQLLVKSLCYQGYKRFNSNVFTLFVNKSNHSAFNLYRKLGFQITKYDAPMPNDESWYMARQLRLNGSAQ